MRLPFPMTRGTRAECHDLGFGTRRSCRPSVTFAPSDSTRPQSSPPFPTTLFPRRYTVRGRLPLRAGGRRARTLPRWRTVHSGAFFVDDHGRIRRVGAASAQFLERSLASEPFEWTATERVVREGSWPAPVLAAIVEDGVSSRARTGDPPKVRPVVFPDPERVPSPSVFFCRATA